MSQGPEEKVFLINTMPSMNRVMVGTNFSFDMDKLGVPEVLEINVQGYGLVRLEIGFRELTIGVYDDKDGPRAEFTVPHSTFGDGLPTIKSVRDGKD